MFIRLDDQLIRKDDIAAIQPYDSAKNPKLQSDKTFRARIVKSDRSSFLVVERTPEQIAREAGFLYLPQDGVALNVDVVRSFERFDLTAAQERNPEFKPTREFQSRAIWSTVGEDGKTEQQSLLLVTPLDQIAAVPDAGLARSAAIARQGRAAASSAERSGPSKG